MNETDRLRAACARVLQGSDLLVEDVTVTRAGQRRVVTVVVDRAVETTDPTTTPTAPLTLDEVAAVARTLDPVVDAEAGTAAYTLDVTSPGLGRPLTQPRHFRRNVARLVSLTTATESLVGRVTSADDTAVTVDVPPTRGRAARTVQIPYAAIVRAGVEVEFTRTAQTPPDPTEPVDDADGTDPTDPEES